MATAPAVRAQAATMMDRVFAGAIAAMDLATIHLGRELGLYSALAAHGSATAPELAAATGTDVRYVREWLEHQAVGGLLDVDDPAAAAEERGYSVPPGHAEALLDHESPCSVGPLAQFVVGAIVPIEQVLDAFRSGDGVPYAAFPICRLGQAEVNRGMFHNELASAWLPALPDVHERLRDEGGRVADLACGAGWSTIELARAYPLASVEGYDVDAPSIELARANARGTDVEARVGFRVADGAGLDGGAYDLVTIFEAVHDLAQPVDVLAAARRLLRRGGAVLVADEKVADEFSPRGDDVERMMYGYSVLFCLPTSREQEPSAATGTAIRASTMEAYAREAGFTRVQVLDVDNDVWRFYRLTP
jgi:ubiquinone/menaquinone biosynthesis C-methylase UbiE